MKDYVPEKTYPATSVIRRDVFDNVWSRICAAVKTFPDAYGDLRCDDLDWSHRFVHGVEEAVEGGKELGPCVHHYVHAMKQLEITSRSTTKTLAIVSLRFDDENHLLTARFVEINDAGTAARGQAMTACLVPVPDDEPSFTVGLAPAYYVGLNEMITAWKKRMTLRLDPDTKWVWEDAWDQQMEAGEGSETRKDHTGPVTMFVDLNMAERNDAKKGKEEETADVEIEASAVEAPGTETMDRNEAKRVYKLFSGRNKATMTDDERLLYNRAKHVLKTTPHEKKKEAREDHTGPLAQIVEFDLMDGNDAKKEEKEEEKEKEKPADVEVEASTALLPKRAETMDRETAKRVFKKFAGCAMEKMSDHWLLEYVRAKQILRTMSQEETKKEVAAVEARISVEMDEAVASIATGLATLRALTDDNDEGKLLEKKLRHIEHILHDDDWDGVEVEDDVSSVSTTIGDALRTGQSFVIVRP